MSITKVVYQQIVHEFVIGVETGIVVCSFLEQFWVSF